MDLESLAARELRFRTCCKDNWAAGYRWTFNVNGVSHDWVRFRWSSPAKCLQSYNSASLDSFRVQSVCPSCDFLPTVGRCPRVWLFATRFRHPASHVRHKVDIVSPTCFSHISFPQSSVVVSYPGHQSISTCQLPCHIAMHEISNHARQQTPLTAENSWGLIRR
jgi:hypothetical protein